MNDLKFDHKLTDDNYKKLAIISRMVQLIALEYIPPVSIVLISLFFLLDLPLYQKDCSFNRI